MDLINYDNWLTKHLPKLSIPALQVDMYVAPTSKVLIVLIFNIKL